MEFKKKNLYDIYFKMSLEEVIDYYQELRKYELQTNDKIKGIQIRKVTYKIVRLILLIDEILSKREVTIIGDDRNIIYDPIQDETEESKKRLNGNSRVYSCTHIGRYDIETLIRGLNDSCSFVMADPGESYTNIDGLLLRLNGVTWFEMASSIDRHAANVRQIKILSQGGNELVFPEAAYNLDPIDPVGKLHPGAFRRAIKTNSHVIPASLEQYEKNNKKNYILNIGKSISTNSMEDTEVDYLTQYIRNEMIELKKEIWKLYGGRKPTLEEFEADPLAIENYKDRIDFIMRDVPSYYSINEIVKEYYSPSDLMIKSLKKIDYLK